MQQAEGGIIVGLAFGLAPFCLDMTMKAYDFNPQACRRLACALILQQARIYTGRVRPDPNTRGSLEDARQFIDGPPLHFWSGLVNYDAAVIRSRLTQEHPP